MIAENFKEIIAYTAQLSEQELTGDDVDLALDQSQNILEMIASLNISNNSEVDEVVENMLYTQREIMDARLDNNDNSDAQFIVNRFLSYVEEAHQVFYQMGIVQGIDPNAGN